MWCQESTQPGPWLFHSQEALAEAKRLKAEAEAAQGKKKKDGQARWSKRKELLVSCVSGGVQACFDRSTLGDLSAR